MNDGVYPELARVASALAHPTRLRALNLVFQGEKSIEALAGLLGESPANTAAHMKSLREAGLVTARRRGKHVFQAADAPSTVRLFLALREAAEATSAAVRLLEHRGDEAASSVAIDALEAAVGPRRALLVDLRPAEEYQAGHLPGAASLPMSALSERVGALSPRRRILAYCRGKYCPNARKGTAALRAAGLRAERLAFGVPEWRAAGRELEIGGGR
jgi:DNA-binding transcriptional ArsR family regulator/rhodanese-related sulfurtransferase